MSAPALKQHQHLPRGEQNPPTIWMVRLVVPRLFPLSDPYILTSPALAMGRKPVGCFRRIGGFADYTFDYG